MMDGAWVIKHEELHLIHLTDYQAGGIVQGMVHVGQRGLRCRNVG